MKKLFAVALAAMMLISCFAISVAADEVERVVITDCSVLEGWESDANLPGPELNDTLSDYPVVSFTYTGTVHSNGGWNGPEGTTGVKLHYKVFKTEAAVYDLSNMKYMIFDLYVSDPSKVEGTNFWLELTSVEKSDTEERNWKQPLSFFVGGEVVEGWNHIELDLSTFTGDSGFRTENWTYLRFHNADGFEAGEGFTLAFKDIYFSNVSPKAAAAAAAAERIIELYAPLMNISSGDVNADNYATIKAQFAAATEAFNAADMATQTAVDAACEVGKVERTVSRAIEKYEEEAGVVDAPADEPADEPTDEPAEVPTDEPTDAPASNNIIVIAAIAAAAVIAVVAIVVIAKKKK